MKSYSRRTEARYLVHIPLRLICNGSPYFGVTEDVSNSGLRIRSDAHPQLRSLLRVEVHLPSGRRLTLAAVVDHVGLDQGHSQPAVGLQIYGISDEDNIVWRSFINHAGQTTRVRRYGDCVGGVAALYPATPADLGIIQRAARAGTQLFVPTSMCTEAGDSLHAIVVHPSSHSLFALTATVSLVVHDHNRPGVFVRMERMGTRQRVAFGQFVATAHRRIAHRRSFVSQNSTA